MKALIIIFAVFFVAVGAVLAYAATKPDVFEVRRTIVVNTTPDKIFPPINDLKSWMVWPLYEKKDPAMQRTYSSATSGKDETYAWNGDKNVGSGSMEILDAPAPKRHHQARLHQAVRGSTTSPTSGWSPRPAAALGGELVDERADAVRWQDHPCVHRHGQDGRPRLRSGPRQHQDRRREVTAALRA